jgi:hypothetical protein
MYAIAMASSFWHYNFPPKNVFPHPARVYAIRQKALGRQLNWRLADPVVRMGSVFISNLFSFSGPCYAPFESTCWRASDKYGCASKNLIAIPFLAVDSNFVVGELSIASSDIS